MMGNGGPGGGAAVPNRFPRVLVIAAEIDCKADD